MIHRLANLAAVAAGFALLLGGTCQGIAAVSPAELPPALRRLPLDTFLDLFSISWETPSLAAEVARLRAWAPPGSDLQACSALAKVIKDYPMTSDARRALLDIALAYAHAGDWTSARAPFLYAMDLRRGKSEARVAHFRLIELYHRSGAPPGGVDPVAECRLAIEAYAGTPEEGLGRMLLADMLAAREEGEPAFLEFERC